MICTTTFPVSGYADNVMHSDVRSQDATMENDCMPCNNMSAIVKTYEQFIRSKTSNEDIVISFVMQRYVDKQHGYHVGGWAYALYP